jgi:hypothetical protein
VIAFDRSGVRRYGHDRNVGKEGGNDRDHGLQRRCRLHSE